MRTFAETVANCDIAPLRIAPCRASLADCFRLTTEQFGMNATSPTISAEVAARLPRLAVAAVLAGVVLRLQAFSSTRGLWLDEAMLARNIVNRSLAGLFEPLAYSQAAPPGYLVLAKLSVLLVGRNEYGLRLVSCLAAIGALLVFAALARRLFRRHAITLACALFAFCPWLVYYAGETKQYSLDVMAATAILYVVRRFGDPAKPDFRVLALCGALAVWFSQPAIFVVAAAGLELAARLYRSPQRRHLLVVGFVWLASFAASYLLARRLTAASYGELTTYWSSSFTPRSVSAAAHWLDDRYWGLFSAPFEFVGPFIAWLFALGLVAMAIRSESLLLLCLSPYLFLLLAATMRLYPLAPGRLTLFTVPVAIIGAVEGWQAIAANATWWISGTLALVLVVPPLQSARLKTDFPREDIRPLMRKMADEIRDGDHIFVVKDAEPQFSLYAQDFGYLAGKHVSTTIGDPRPDDPAGYERMLEPLQNHGRTWIVVSHQRTYEMIDDAAVAAAARKQGREARLFTSPGGAAIHLFLFGGSAEP
jgi:hypothetical protein